MDVGFGHLFGKPDEVAEDPKPKMERHTFVIDHVHPMGDHQNEENGNHPKPENEGLIDPGKQQPEASERNA